MSEDEKKDTPQPQEGEDKTEENEVVSDDKDLKSALAQKEHFREKFEKLEKENEELKANVEKPKEEKPQTQPQPTETKDESKAEELTSRIDKIEFAQKHQELDAKDIDDVFQLAQMTSKTPDAVLEENEMVKVYLKDNAAQKKVADATPTGGARSGSVKSDKPISEMSREEHMKWAQEVMEQ